MVKHLKYYKMTLVNLKYQKIQFFLNKKIERK